MEADDLPCILDAREKIPVADVKNHVYNNRVATKKGERESARDMLIK